jgi:hypothetical protein
LWRTGTLRAVACSVGGVDPIPPVATPPAGTRAARTSPVSGDHRPERPEWYCGTCGAEWPCEGARKLLGELYLSDPDELARHMSRIMVWAARELPSTKPGLLYQRFVRWALPNDSRCRVCGKAGHDFTPGITPRMVPCDGYVVEPLRRARRR